MNSKRSETLDLRSYSDDPCFTQNWATFPDGGIIPVFLCIIPGMSDKLQPEATHIIKEKNKVQVKTYLDIFGPDICAMFDN